MVPHVKYFYLENSKVGAQTETELKEKKLRVEDALNATKVTHVIILTFKSMCPSVLCCTKSIKKITFFLIIFRQLLRKVLLLEEDAPF